jgi:protein-S-isoprenylcysteine O-methyltransferase Ste14
MIASLTLSLLYLAFAVQHIQFGLVHPHQWLTVGPILVQETTFMVLFAIRREGSTSGNPVDWIVGIAGAFLPLLLRIEVQPGLVAHGGVGLQVVGLAISTSALWCLGRSVGIVAANRGVVTTGWYRVVRHPMYLGHVLTLVGYGLASPTEWNMWLVIATWCALVARIHVEELWLVGDGRSRDWVGYQLYRSRVRWRLILGVW